MLRRTTGTTWALLLVSLLGAACAADPSILCYGVDGHVSLEASTDGVSCGRSSEWPRGASHAPSAAPFGPAREHCGPCEDVVLIGLFRPDLVPPGGGSPWSPPLAAAARAHRAPASVETITEGVAQPPPPATTPTLASLRATVILI